MTTTPQRHLQLVLENQARNRNKHNARKAVGKKVKSGKILPAKSFKCSDCPNQADHYDHPNGYDGVNRFIIEPVCRACHVKRGKARKEYRNQHTREKG